MNKVSFFCRAMLLGAILAISVPQEGWAQFNPPRITDVINKASLGGVPDSVAAGRSYVIDRGREVNILAGDELNVYRERRPFGTGGALIRVFIGVMKIDLSQQGAAIGKYTPNQTALDQPFIKYKGAMKGDVVVPRFIIDSGVLFDAGRFQLREGASIEFKKVADFVKMFSPGKLVIEGHTDSDGDNASNMKLSEQRAEAVKGALESDHGIPQGMIEAMGYGEERPTVNNDTPENKALNRRIEVIIWE